MDEKLQKGCSEVRAVSGHWWELTWSLILANSLSIQVIRDSFYRKWFNAAVSSSYRKHHNRDFLLIYRHTNNKWQNSAQTVTLGWKEVMEGTRAVRSATGNFSSLPVLTSSFLNQSHFLPAWYLQHARAQFPSIRAEISQHVGPATC